MVLALLLAGAALWGRLAPGGSQARPAAVVAEPAVASRAPSGGERGLWDKDLHPADERFRLRSTSDGVRVYEKAAPKDEAAVEQLVQAASVPLTTEELDLLREASSDDLGRMVAEAETNYVRARTPEERAFTEHRYTVLLELASKLAEPGPEPTAAERDAYHAYLKQESAMARQLVKYPPEKRAEIIDRAKEQHFNAAASADRVGNP